MIAWLGPAMLLLMLAASQPVESQAGSGAVATVLAEEFAAAVAAPAVERILADVIFMAPPGLSEPRVLPRCRSVRESGLPAPRAP